MRKLHMDIETFSSVDLKKCGVYRYTEAPDFEIMILAWQFDEEEVDATDITDWYLPEEVMDALTDPTVLKYAHNASFERTCIAKAFDLVLDPKQWRCTAVMAAELGLPRDLFNLGRVMRLGDSHLKSGIGRSLISYFCKPCKPTKVNGGRFRNQAWHDIERWNSFVEYCKQDVRAESAVEDMLSRVVMHENEWDIWALDQHINDRGAMVDLDFVRNAVAIGVDMTKALMGEAKKLTRLKNPNSIKQLQAWLSKELDEEVESLTKDSVKGLLEGTDDETITRVLEIRQQLGKTSTKKYDALIGATCEDQRIRGTLLFYGASRTGRWAGRIFQPQNLPQNKMSNIEDMRKAVKVADYETLEMLLDNGVASVLSQLIRTAIVPKPGCKFIVADYSAVEARALAWIADEKWRLDVFRTHGKIYEASASAAFGVPMESITKDSPLRQQGKVLELACGYGGSVGAIETMDYDNAIAEKDRKPMVRAWRAASPNITQLWWDMGDAAMQAVQCPGVVFKVKKDIYFVKEKGWLFMGLPSGRRLAYPRPLIEEGKYGPQVTYEGEDQYTKQWGRISTYGPKLVENLIQAICRDLLAYGMQQVSDAGYEIVLHVHDEAIIECPIYVEVGVIERLLELKPEWAKEMPHAAEGFETLFYKK